MWREGILLVEHRWLCRLRDFTLGDHDHEDANDASVNLTQVSFNGRLVRGWSVTLATVPLCRYTNCTIPPPETLLDADSTSLVAFSISNMKTRRTYEKMHLKLICCNRVSYIKRLIV